MKNILLSFVFLLSGYALLAQNTPLLRFPAISPDGSQVAFSYQGDIWTVATDGGLARRLTIHESYESNPRWSPDGKSIAFQGNRFGNNDIFVMDANGGAPKRLTFHSANDIHPNWTKDNKILFETSRAYRQLEWDDEIHIVDANGGTPHRYMDGFGMEAVGADDGRLVAYTRGGCRFVREAYTGPANRSIWVYDSKNKTYNAVADAAAMESSPSWGKGRQLYFLSAAKGRYNIHTIALDASGAATGPEQTITSFTDEGIRHFDVSADGEHMVFERNNGIYYMPTKVGGKAVKINVDVNYDDRFDPVTHETFSSRATAISLSPNEENLLIGVHGEIFARSTDKDKKRTTQLTKHAYRDQAAKWLNDSTALFISDRDGNKDIFLVRSADTSQVNLVKSLKHEVKKFVSTPLEEDNFTISPDGKKITISRNRHSLIIADVDENGISNERTLLEGWEIPSSVAWSPDSKWIAYAKPDLNFNYEVYIHAVDGSSEAVNVSMHPRYDHSPFFSADGSKLGFLSLRNNGDYDVWFAWLNKEDWQKSEQEWEDADDEEEEEESDDEEEEKTIVVDLKNIHQRLVQVTRFPGDEDDLVISADGETFFFTVNNDGGDEASGKVDLQSIKWDGSDLKTLASDMPLRRLSIDKSGKYLYLLKRNGSIAKMKIEGKKSEGLAFQAKMDIDHVQERKQVLDEVWRSLNQGFYDPEFHGQNWEELRKKYEPIALSASTNQDFRAILNTMLGQLNASHMGVYGRGPEETQTERTGYIGVEVMQTKGGVKVTRVVPNTAADRSVSKLNVGDVITAVNGNAINSTTNFYALMEGTRNERTLMHVNNAKGDAREVVIRPQSSIRTALYDEWVESRKELTEKLSNGRLGYIHIRGMNWSSFERFERELTASGLGKEGIVIDVRYNGGGWTTDMLMAVMNVRQHAYTIPRGATNSLNNHQKFSEYYPYGERLPLAALTKPSVALCNESSYSNAEIFSHAYKHLNHGDLVGMPTFGAVISTGGQGLIDGSFVRMPFRAWYVKATGENMELSPAVPDVQLQNSADHRAKGVDEQLKKAIDLLLEK